MRKRQFRNRETGLTFWASPLTEPSLSFFQQLKRTFEEVTPKEDLEPIEPLEEDQSQGPARHLASSDTTSSTENRPKGNASRDAWLAYALELEPDADLSGLSRDELRRRFG